MERASNKHSPRIDDDLESTSRSLVQGSPVEARADEHRQQEAPGEGEPAPDSRLTGDPALKDPDVLRYDEIEARSDLARYLEPSVFPAGRQGLIASAIRMNAPEAILAQLNQLPDGEFTHTEAVWEALGGRVEFRG